MYANLGRNVCLLDLDVYAPSLYAYFNKEPQVWLNDVLSGEAKIRDCLMDVSSELGTKGKLSLALSSPRKEDVYAFEALQDKKWQLAALRRFLGLKEELLSDMGFDYVLLDTSPGIHYWSINALVAADILILMSKYMNMDIEGTRKMVSNIYDALGRFGSKSFVVLNRVEGSGFTFRDGIPVPLYAVNEEKAKKRQDDVKMTVALPVLASIPCYCDIQFDPHEFLFALKEPSHPFSKTLQAIGASIDQIG
jgi:MinD-like ATPase involved in chromosome partitioning or flagellar assembly